MTGRVLVIEDDKIILEMVTEMLQGDGYEVIGLRYPDLALNVVEQERPDLILVDIMLPKRSGIEVAEEVRGNGFGSIPVVAMSASTIMVDLADHAECFCAVLQKPFDMDVLLDTLHGALTASAPGHESVEQGAR